MAIPETPDKSTTPANAAADLIRQRLNQIYNIEPDAKEELKESENLHHRSKHQQYMYDLGQSGKTLAEIQTAWHEYYLGLPDDEKHVVWQEFYEEHNRRSGKLYLEKTPEQPPKVLDDEPAKRTQRKQPTSNSQSVKDVKEHLLNNINRHASKNKSHLKSLVFGLSSGLVVVVILLFSFFNERFLAPFITPSKSVSATPIIIDPNSTSAGPEPRLIIPKINAELPVIYTEPSIEEHAVQRALQDGVLHYATTSKPGEKGNGVIFGHSSNNLLNKGQYKFAFVLLHRLENGDTFMIQKDSKRYVYKVFAKRIVKPEEVSVLSDANGKLATFSLITCDPPGTSLNRLVVTGEQINPDPSKNSASTVKPIQSQPKILPSNSPSLWQRFKDWVLN